MVVDEGARHRLYLRLEAVLGQDEAETLMGHLPPASYGELATRDDLVELEERMTLRMEALEHRLSSTMERLARQGAVWTSGMVLATGGLAFAAGRFV
jgi:hypothetical protein